MRAYTLPEFSRRLSQKLANYLRELIDEELTVEAESLDAIRVVVYFDRAGKNNQAIKSQTRSWFSTSGFTISGIAFEGASVVFSVSCKESVVETIL